MWSYQIGHLALLDGYFKLAKLGWRPDQQPVVLLATRDHISNPYLLSLWRPFLKVVSDPEDFLGRSGTTGRSSSPWAMAWYHGPDLPKRRCRNSTEQRPRSAPVKMPSAFILAAVTGPTPWNLATERAATNAGPISGVMTYCPFGFR